MIRHIVFFGLKDPKTLPQVEQHLYLLANIKEHSYFEVKANTKQDPYGNEVDLVVYAEFEDGDHLQRYMQHPLYSHCRQLVKPLRSSRYCVNLEV